MKRLLQYFALPLSILLILTTSPLAQRKLKEIKIVGYITEFHSPTSFEIEDYRITRDESVVVEFENQRPDVDFKLSDLRIGTLVEIRGLFDEITDELKATKMKVDLEQFRRLDVTTILDRKALEVTQTETGWTGLIVADGRRVHIGADTKMLFSPNRTEKKTQKKQEKIAGAKKKRAEKPKDDDWTRMEKASGDDAWAEGTASKPAVEEFVPLKTLADIGPGVG
jgi:hypothetical protein